MHLSSVTSFSLPPFRLLFSYVTYPLPPFVPRLLKPLLSDSGLSFLRPVSLLPSYSGFSSYAVDSFLTNVCLLTVTSTIHDVTSWLLFVIVQLLLPDWLLRRCILVHTYYGEPPTFPCYVFSFLACKSATRIRLLPFVFSCQTSRHVLFFLTLIQV